MTPSNAEKKKEYPYHRRFVRHPVRLQIRVRRGESYDTWTENVSRGGLCFVIPNRIAEGQEVDVSIGLRTKPAGQIRCKCRIVWNEKKGEDCRHGGKFTTFEGKGLEHLTSYLAKF